MDTPGSVLRTEREKQKTPLEEIAKSLKLNIEYLKAIENEEYHLIPAEIYTKAYLRFYARALGLDSDLIISLYQKQSDVSSIQKPIPSEKKPGLSYKSFLTVASLVIIGMIVMLAGHREPPLKPVQGTKEPLIAKPKESQVNREISEFRELSSADTKEQEVKELTRETAEPETMETKGEDTSTTLVDKSISLKIVATDTTWISVGVDGSKPKEWLLNKGEKISLSASEKFSIKIGNAAGARVSLNDEDIGKLGEQGQVMELVLPKKNE